MFTLHNILDRLHLTDCNPTSTPILPSTKLYKTLGTLLSNPTIYRSTIGSLQYLTLTRPDIAFAVNKLSQFLQNPTDIHWLACKHLIRYLKGTAHLSLIFNPSPSQCFAGFSDADWAGSLDDRRSTTGLCVFYGSNIIHWSSKKQEVVGRSSAEAEYRALSTAAAELLWLHSLCQELHIHFPLPSQLWCDNRSAILLASNSVFHARTKHVEVDVHFIREKVQGQLLTIGHVPSEDQVADVFTKALPSSRFLLLRRRLRLGG